MFFTQVYEGRPSGRATSATTKAAKAAKAGRAGRRGRSARRIWTGERNITDPCTVWLTHTGTDWLHYNLIMHEPRFEYAKQALRFDLPSQSIRSSNTYYRVRTVKPNCDIRGRVNSIQMKINLFHCSCYCITVHALLLLSAD